MIWDWRATKPRRNAAAPGKARQRGVLRGLGLAAVGALLFAFWSHVLGGIALGISAIVVLSALASPTGLYAAIERGLGALTHATGTGLTWVLMSVFFFGVVTPFGLIFRRGRHDAMRRYYEPDATTYWTARELGRSASIQRARQF
jgi:hypothetical protein